MIDILTGTVLPIFFVGLIGYLGGLKGGFTQENATSVNRFVFFVSLPVLLVRLIGGADFFSFDWLLLLGFVGTELFVYFLGYLIALKGFGRGQGESLLIGLASAFTNHVLFVLPVALYLFGDSAALPITAIIVVDGTLLFMVTLFILDTLTASQRSPVLLLNRYLRNPQIMAVALGLILSIGQISLPTGIDLFLKFTGAAAAPCALFALGILLSQRSPFRNPGLPLFFTGFKLVVHPLLSLIVLVYFLRIDWESARPAMMVAAGPSGLSAFVLAVNYQIPVESIARIILFSSVVSLFTVSLTAAW